MERAGSLLVMTFAALCLVLQAGAVVLQAESFNNAFDATAGEWLEYSINVPAGGRIPALDRAGSQWRRNHAQDI